MKRSPVKPDSAYYTTLGPFREWFAQGVPMLMYHKLGPRPAKVQMKGLYVSKTLFSRQLTELKSAGFHTPSLDQLATPAEKLGSQIVLTFDDGFENVLRYGLEPLARTQLRAVQFLVADLIGKTNEWEQRMGEAKEKLMDAAQIREWLAAGHEIGAHTLTHPYLTKVSLAEAREEIGASKRKLEDLFGVPIRHFCYPFGDWNPAVRDLVAEAGYATACTVDFGINDVTASPFGLRRITARYRTRNWKTLKDWIQGKVGKLGGKSAKGP